MAEVLPLLAPVRVHGKFLYAGDEKFYIRGVTYGTFAPTEEGHQFPTRPVVEKDFALMAASGVNTVRTYTVPPNYVFDIALQYGMRLMVGLPWEQHITFLDDPQRQQDIIDRVQAAVALCRQHPAIVCFAVGNEIPAPIVRWYGPKKIEQFLQQLYQAVKRADSEALVTYVNYPTTEYLHLSFFDFDCFNVYLEDREKLAAYISRLHNLYGNRPLVLAEIGLDSMRNGEGRQADVLQWQIETVFGKGCAGMFVFAWTDEWWRGGFEIEDWDFGLVTRNRQPKPALPVVAQALQNLPVHLPAFPLISVIVCTYNGAATIRDTMQGLMQLPYPNFEVIVVNDGSTDNVAAIVQQYPVRLITTRNNGLSSARNTGMYAARGTILAYIDDDAYPEEHWLHYLAYAYTTSQHGAIGGPNIIPANDGLLAHCVADAPGGPVHVLLTDEIAEHIPGCNFSVLKSVLMEVGGFDPRYRAAGDDVDACWRIQEAGYTIGYHPSAMVWHHRRNSLKAYWKQQKGYGKAEALLEAKWPERYNGLGHLAWAGFIYGGGCNVTVKTQKDKIFFGTWGSAPFQSVYQPGPNFIFQIPFMPEWYLFMGLLALPGLAGFIWAPLFWFLPAFAFALGIFVLQAAISAGASAKISTCKHQGARYKLILTCLYIIQPVARLNGRLVHGLTPWRRRGAGLSINSLSFGGSRVYTYWNEAGWKSADDWLETIEQNLVALRTRVTRGGDFDRWDLQVRSGWFTKARGLLAIEEHGANKQYLKFKCTHVHSRYGYLTILILAAISIASMYYQVWAISFFAGPLLLVLVTKYLIDSISVCNSLKKGFLMLGEEKDRKSDVLQVANKTVFSKPEGENYHKTGPLQPGTEEYTPALVEK